MPTLPTAGAFTVAFIPDSQNLVKDDSVSFLTQMAWLVANKAAHNIQMVVHVGDIVNDPGTIASPGTAQWAAADAGFALLDAGAVPYMVALGNHDYDDGGSGGRITAVFDSYFPQSRFTGQAGWSGGFLDGVTADNSYRVVTISGVAYLFLQLECGPRQAVVDWANALLTTHADKLVILTTHGYLGNEGEQMIVGSLWYVSGPFLPCLQGKDLWDQLVSQHDNIIWVQSGHILYSDYTASNPALRFDLSPRRQDVLASGHIVNQVGANFQNTVGTGQGYLRLVQFDPALRRATVQTISPVAGLALADDSNQFTVTY